MLKYTQCTEDELNYAYSVNKYIEDNSIVLYRSVSINADKNTVFKWLTQLRFAPYSYDWIDNFGKESPQYIITAAPALKSGDSVMTIFRVTEFQDKSFLTFTLTKNSPCYLGVLQKIFLKSFYVTYQLIGDGETRLIVKIVINTYQNLFHKFLVKIADIVDYVMMRRQLLNFKRLAEKRRKL